MPTVVPAVVAVVLAYLLGSVLFGVIVPRASGVDIYAVGSGNPGTSNVYRSIGKKAALATLVGDFVKGLVATAIGALWVGGSVGFLCMFAAVVGHVFPVWHGFKGGRGVATALGGAAWLVPMWGIILAVGWLGVVIATKTASIASLVSMILMVPGMILFGVRGWPLVWAALAVAMVIAKHAPNIRRIVRGSERTVVGATSD